MVSLMHFSLCTNSKHLRLIKSYSGTELSYSIMTRYYLIHSRDAVGGYLLATVEVITVLTKLEFQIVGVE